MSSGPSPEQTPAEPVLPSEGPAAFRSSDSRPIQDRFAVILEQILSASEDQADAQADPCRAGLLAVAARYSSHELCMDPVLLELIQVMTRQMKGFSDNRLNAMERAVAASLLEDTVSLQRLQHFWEQLKRLVSNEK